MGEKNEYMYDGVREIGQLNSTQISTQLNSVHFLIFSSPFI